MVILRTIIGMVRYWRGFVLDLGGVLGSDLGARGLDAVSLIE